ncbi:MULTISPECIES: hypothetical protein [unclassified Nocardiopsis]|uniref:hypothetical protein n=1 Tax=unclassified Nocardiopsis TaxID=2649073 RepID=UPI00135B9291|nr:MULTISPECIES: hypothetical protein [unclassified Nocardiopsis]
MPRIMVAGSGHAGLGIATGLLAAGVDVDVFTTHTTEELLGGPARLTQLTFPTVHAIEKKAGLDLWEQISPVFSTISLTVASGQGGPQSFVGHQRQLGTSVDHRAKTAYWLQEVERRKGRIHVKTVTRQDLVWFANSGMYDLVIVATGDSDPHLAPLFPAQPQPRPATVRAVIQAHFEGAPPGPDVQVTTTPFGEVFCYPVLIANGSASHPEVYPGTAVQIYARQGGPLDPATKSIEPGQRPENLQRIWAFAHEVLAAYTPDLAEWCAGADLVRRSQLLRYVHPVVRQPVVPLGRAPVLGVGDAVLAVDPTSGQGANASTLAATTVVDQITERLAQGGALADTSFLTAAYGAYYDRHGRYTSLFSQLVTDFWNEALAPHVPERFGRNFTDQDQADRMVIGWDDPSTLGWLLNP